MGTKNNPGKYDCYTKADPQEPMFILLGRDPMAPALIRTWAKMREAAGEDPEKVREALVCADVMATWAIRQGKALITLPDQTEAIRDDVGESIRKIMDAITVATASLLDTESRIRELLGELHNKIG